MLRIAMAATHVAQAKSYLIQGSHSSRADYYASPDDLPGTWGGQLAQRLGLSGPVSVEAFHRLCENQHPLTGDRLTPRTRAGRRIGFDFNFHVPKSLTLLWSATQDNDIITALQQSVRLTMAELEQDAQTRVRKNGADHNRTTGNMVWGEFVHHTSRPTDTESPPDLHLHVHAFVFNATYDPAEQCIKALQKGYIHEHAPYFQAVFHHHLARKIQELGYPIERTGKVGWEVRGVDRQLINRFSRRTQQIEAKAAELNITDPDAKGELGAKTRQGKDKEASLQEIIDHTHSRMSPDELDQLRSCRHQPPPIPISPHEALEYAVEHCFSRASVVTDREIVKHALIAQLGSTTYTDADVWAAFEECELLTHQPDTPEASRRLVTTPQALAEEERMIEFAKSGRGQCPALASVDRVIPPDVETGIQLNDQQQAAVRHIWSSPDRVMAIAGSAGVGKTTLMNQAIKGLEAEGHKIVVLAPSASASRGVLRQKGFRGANTIAMFLKDVDMKMKAKNGIIWIDEAGLVDVATMNKVMDVAKKQDSRIVLMGDTRQHNPVSRGDAMHLMEKYGGISPLYVKKIVRQKDGPLKDAVQHLSEGEIDKGYQALDRMGAIHEIEDEHKRYATLAKNYVDAKERGETVLAVAPTHSESDKVTQAIRTELEAREQKKNPERDINAESITIASHRNLQWTEAQKGRGEQYEPGQKLYFHRAAKGIPSGAWVDVTDVSSPHKVQGITNRGKQVNIPLDKPERFSVYQPGTIDVRPGEQLRCMQNMRGTDKRRTITNSCNYEFQGLLKNGKFMKLKDPKSKAPPFTVEVDRGLFTHSYCRTSHSAQGWDAQNVFIAQSRESLAASSTEQFYVSSSRGVQAVHVFTDDQVALQQKIRESSLRKSASDLWKEAKTKPNFDVLRERYGRYLEQQRRQDREQTVMRDLNRSPHQMSHRMDSRPQSPNSYREMGYRPNMRPTLSPTQAPPSRANPYYRPPQPRSRGLDRER